MGIEHKL